MLFCQLLQTNPEARLWFTWKPVLLAGFQSRERAFIRGEMLGTA